MEHWDGETKGSVATFVAAYALWALTMVVAFAACAFWHGALIELYFALRLSKWGFAAYTYGVVIALVLGWLVLIIATEGWYRRAAEEGKLIRRGAWMLGILVALAALGMAIGRLG